MQTGLNPFFAPARRLDNAQGLANWDAEFVIEHGTAISAECKRVFISAKQGIQKHFDLAGGG